MYLFHLPLNLWDVPLISYYLIYAYFRENGRGESHYATVEVSACVVLLITILLFCYGILVICGYFFWNLIYYAICKPWDWDWLHDYPLSFGSKGFTFICWKRFPCGYFDFNVRLLLSCSQALYVWSKSYFCKFKGLLLI